MFRTFYIKPHERGILYRRGAFKTILMPGTHRRMGWHWHVQIFDLNQPEAQIDHLEFLAANEAFSIQSHLTLVRTQFNQVALVQLGQRWTVVYPNQFKAFWKGFLTVEVHLFNLDDTRELPQTFVAQLRQQSLPGLTLIQITESQMGMLYENNNFMRPLEPGEYGFWNLDQSLSVPQFNRTQPAPRFDCTDVLIEKHPQFVQEYCEAVQLGDQSVAIARHKGKVIDVLPPCSQRLFWKGVEIEVIDLNQQDKLPSALVSELVTGLTDTLELSLPYLHMLEVPAQHQGLLYVEGAFRETLPPGLHVWWVFGQSLKTELVDLRLQTLEVSGQEILSKDKVSLRVNLSASFRIDDPVKAKTGVKDVEDFLYKELQFGLRAAVGTKRLDTFLEDKESIDVTVANYIRSKAEVYGITIHSVGVKDIILPGEMKMILGQVVEAEKSAQANVIRRREETAATRSMLNTAKVMEDNPVALRLKELEVLERIADKIEHIHVNGSLDSILTDLIRINATDKTLRVE